MANYLTKGVLLAAGMFAAAAAPITATAVAQSAGAVVDSPNRIIEVGVGKGTLLALPRTISDVFVVDQRVADVEVKSERELYVFGTGGGETTIYATDSRGRTVYSASVRVTQNTDQMREVLAFALPDAKVNVTALNGMVLLSGTVASPDEVAEATRLVTALGGADTTIVNKLRTATPPQVMLRVRFAEVSRNLLKDFSASLEILGSEDFIFGIFRGRDGINVADTPLGREVTLTAPGNGTGLGFFDTFGNTDVGALLDALEQDGLITVLAEPNLTALSGETASFLAGGEFPIAVSDGDGGVSVEFKQFGVSLAFTPTVIADSRIALRVRPEVSDLSEAGAIRLNSISIPALTTRKAETSIELGSGQSFMIGGLMRNSMTSSVEKTPFLGDLPVLGALFRSQNFRRDESELVIVVTPYLVRPVDGRLPLPTDGVRAPNDAERILLGNMAKPAAGAPVDARRAAETDARPGFSVR